MREEAVRPRAPVESQPPSDRMPQTHRPCSFLRASEDEHSAAFGRNQRVQERERKWDKPQRHGDTERESLPAGRQG